jgi:hypothetical protein
MIMHINCITNTAYEMMMFNNNKNSFVCKKKKFVRTNFVFDCICKNRFNLHSLSVKNVRLNVFLTLLNVVDQFVPFHVFSIC